MSVMNVLVHVKNDLLPLFFISVQFLKRRLRWEHSSSTSLPHALMRLHASSEIKILARLPLSPLIQQFAALYQSGNTRAMQPYHEGMVTFCTIEMQLNFISCRFYVMPKKFWIQTSDHCPITSFGCFSNSQHLVKCGLQNFFSRYKTQTLALASLFLYHVHLKTVQQMICPFK